MPILPWKRGKGKRSFVHMTDFENFVTDFEQGNHFSALRHGVRILNNGLNGPPTGVAKGHATEWELTAADQDKLGGLADRLQAAIDGNELRLGENQAKRMASASHTTKPDPKDELHGARAQAPPGKGTDVEKAMMDKDAKTGKVHGKTVKTKAGKVGSHGEEGEDTDDTADLEKDLANPSTPDDDVITRSNEPNVGAVPWALIVQIALMVLKMIQDFKQQA